MPCCTPMALSAALGKEVVNAGDGGILGNDDHLNAGGVGVGEVDGLQALLVDGHARHAEGVLAGDDAGHDGVKVRVDHFQFIAKLVANGLGDLHVDAG